MSVGQFISAWDYLMAGCMSAGHISLGYPVTLGLYFPFRDGVWLLQCRLLNPPGDWEWCGVADLSSSLILSRPSYALANSSGYQFRAARANGNGYISELTEPIRADLDGAGSLITPALPAWPHYLRSKAVALGKFTVHWTYSAWGQGGDPADFNVYEGVSQSTIDYGTSLGTVTYTGEADYSFTTGVYTDATPHSFAVRARNSGGVSDGNLYTTVPRAAETAAPTGVTIQQIEARQ